MRDVDVAPPPSDVLGNVLGVLGRNSDVAARPLGEILENIAETAAATLHVARVNIWLYDVGRTRITCVEAFDQRKGAHTHGEVLLASEYPRYFEALDALRSIAAMDAENDARTAELRERYLMRHGISTMLDVPIRQGGQVVGVVCHENVGSPRTFSQTDRLFAGSIGDLVALVLETNERLAAERTNLQLKERIARTERVETLGWLAGSIAHDFRNLVFIVSANAEYLKGQLPAGSRVQDVAREIVETARRASELCEQLLSYSGRRPAAPRRIDLAGLAAEITRLLRPRVPEGATLSGDYEPGCPPVLGDPTQLRQLLLNLVLNALDALPDGRGTVRVRVARGEPSPDALLDGYDFRSDRPATIVLEVNDDGHGMSAETRGRLFEPFFTTKSGGHGLGLSAALGIVRAHSGALQVTSAPGSGSRFRIWLPEAT